jgi:hypothetical protein
MSKLGEYDDKPEIVRDLLLLCGVTVPLEIVAAQTSGARIQAARWAAGEHLRASDNFGVRRLPKPGWLRAFELLDSDETARQTALERWAANAARMEEPGQGPCANETVTLALAEGAIMAQQLMLSRMRERIAAALADVTAYGQAHDERLLKRGMAQMARHLLGSDEAYAEFSRRFGGDEHWGEDVL